MKREVAELSGNFRRELSPLDGGEGIYAVGVGVKKENTRKRVNTSERLKTLKIAQTPCTGNSENSTKRKLEEQNERTSEDQNQTQGL